MLAATGPLLTRTLVPMLPGRLDGLGPRRRAANCHVPHGAVGDFEHARHLGERRRVRLEMQDVVVGLALAPDLVRELAPAPRLVPDPAAAALLDQLARARDDLVFALLGELGVGRRRSRSAGAASPVEARTDELRRQFAEAREAGVDEAEFHAAGMGAETIVAGKAPPGGRPPAGEVEAVRPGG